MDDAHAKSWEEVLQHFGVEAEKGLSLDQVKRHQEKYGANGETCILATYFSHYTL
jgi:Ca2+ transporting ATPase